jgi:hypothetical protein
MPDVDASAQTIYDQGQAVGLLAKQIFPAGIEIARCENLLDRVGRTQEMLLQRATLFEAAFAFQGAYAAVDILVPVEADTWDVLEVKSSTSSNELNLEDLAFQAHVLEGWGICIRKYWLLLVDNEYVRHGPVEPEKIFKRLDVTEEVRELSVNVYKLLAKMRATISASGPPVIGIGPHCDDPYPCPLHERCWDFLPDVNVTSLYRGRAKGFEFLSQGILRLAEIADEDALTDNQKIQRRTAITGQPHIDRAAIKIFVNRLAYPLFFLDFETFATAVPLLDSVHPYEQVPFQFSLHILRELGSTPEHYGFLADGRGDPRPAFLESLQTFIGTNGSVVVYNESFELGRLRECAGVYPAFAGMVSNIESRVIDLLEPFRAFHYYHPAQDGSASIKAVLPALVGSGYEHLSIRDGGTASREFVRLTFGEVVDDEDRIETRAALEEYCGLDTMAMVEIVRALSRHCDDQ